MVGLFTAVDVLLLLVPPAMTGGLLHGLLLRDSLLCCGVLAPMLRCGDLDLPILRTAGTSALRTLVGVRDLLRGRVEFDLLL